MANVFISNYVGRNRVRQLVSCADDVSQLYFNLGLALQQFFMDSHEAVSKTITIRLRPDEEFKDINPKVF